MAERIAKGKVIYNSAAKSKRLGLFEIESHGKRVWPRPLLKLNFFTTPGINNGDPVLTGFPFKTFFKILTTHIFCR